MRALVIGADGFAGRWLVRHLLESHDSVDAVVGPRYQPPLLGVDQVENLDVRSLEGLARFVRDSQPEAIYYLAGVSEQGGRDALPAAVGVSVIGAMNTLIAASGVPEPPRILYVSTGLVYGVADRPLREDDPTAPDGLYAVAKLVGEEALAKLGPSAAVDVVIARPFNHIGPGQKEPFIVPFIASQIAEVSKRRSDTIKVRSTRPVRDISDVRDVVRAYRLLVTHALPGSIHNVAIGSGISIDELSHAMLEIAGMSAQVESAETDDAGPPVVGDPSKIKGLGWDPQYSLGQTLTDVLAEYLQP
jgi:GDP-4-dehydro-6-deoxy-D-mannose reductase